MFICVCAVGTTLQFCFHTGRVQKKILNVTISKTKCENMRSVGDMKHDKFAYMKYDQLLLSSDCERGDKEFSRSVSAVTSVPAH